MISLDDVLLLPRYARIAFLLLALALTVALPIYLLVFRSINRLGSWSVGEIAAVSLLFLLTIPLAAGVLSLAGYDLSLSLRSFSVFTIIQNLLFVIVSLYIVCVRYGLKVRRLGLHLDRWQWKLLWGVAAGASTYPLAIGAERLTVALLGLFLDPVRAASYAARELLFDPLLPLIAVLGDPVSLRWILFLLVVVVPVGEEVFFRGLVYGGLRARWGVLTGIVVSSLFFAAMHLQLANGLSILFSAIVFCLLYERTGSLLPPIVAHAFSNGVAVLSLWRGWGL